MINMPAKAALARDRDLHLLRLACLPREVLAASLERVAAYLALLCTDEEAREFIDSFEGEIKRVLS